MSMGRLALASILALAIGCGSAPTERSSRRDEAVDWYLRSIEPDQPTINIVYTMSGVASGCERKGRITANETDDKVEILAYKSVTTDRNLACTEELAYVEETAKLRRPLGDRALVGCRVGKDDPSEDQVCRDPERSKQAGIFDFPPPT